MHDDVTEHSSRHLHCVREKAARRVHVTGATQSLQPASTAPCAANTGAMD